MPEGGIEPGEEPLHAALRELKAEIGTANAELIAESAGWYRYDLPRSLIEKARHGRWRGQLQKWFVMRFLGADEEIDVDTVAPGGWLGDKVHRRRGWAALGYLVTGITTGLHGLFGGWPWILLVRAIGWAGRGLRSPLHDAILTHSVPAIARGRAFGFDEAADTAGAILGPLAALAIISLLAPSVGQLGAYRMGFWLAAIPGVLAAVSILLLVQETPHPLLGDGRRIGSLTDTVDGAGGADAHPSVLAKCMPRGGAKVLGYPGTLS